MKKSKFYPQVVLLLDVLPYIAKESCFALKGDTAINLFVRDFPRLSVDADLTYLGDESREEALQKTEDALHRIKTDLEKQIGAKVMSSSRQSQTTDIKLFVSRDGVQVKIAAALDRQHPRDLFDVKLLLENEGVSRDVMTGFLVYLMCHKRPPNELLKPTLQDQSALFDADFKGMTNIDFDYADFVKTREVLIESHAQELPAIKWKLKNIQKMNAVKKTEAVDLLKQVLKI